MDRSLPFAPPQYDNIEDNYSANMVFRMAWGWIIGVTILTLATVPILPSFWPRALEIVSMVDAAALVSLWINKKGQTKGASLFFSVCLWVIATVLILTSGGINAPALAAYLPVIITSGFLLGGMWGVYMAILSGLSALGFVVLELQGALPARQVVHTPISLWLVYSLSAVLIAMVQYLITSHISNSFRTLEDVSDEKRQAEIKLRESEFNNRMVAENKILGVAWASAEGRVIEASNTFAGLMGYKPEELKGVFFGDFTHPDDTAKELMLINRIMDGEMDNYTIEKRYKHKNGTYFWVELYLTCYRNAADGEVDFFIGLVQNIQQRKLTEEALRESEARYRALVENAVEALVVFDVENRKFESVSKSALQLFKMTEEQMLRVGPADISPKYQPDGRLSAEAAMEKINEAIDGGKPVFEWAHCDINGNLIPCEVRLVRLPSASRILVRGSIIEIAERKAVENAIRNLNESLEKKVTERTHELEVLNHDLFRFNSMLSHDLRGAIRRIKSFSDILLRDARKKGVEPDTLESLEMMKRDALKMDGIITGLLEVSKLGSMPVQLKPVDLNETVHGIINDLKKQWHHKIFELDIRVLPHLNSDPILMQQIFANLLSNAFKYSSKNEVIRVQVEGRKNGDHYTFSITDNGVGFSMADHDKIFKEFIRLHSETDFEGIGIGLNSVKRFVEKLGGRIWAESNPDSGSTFYFSVPHQQEAVPNQVHADYPTSITNEAPNSDAV